MIKVVASICYAEPTRAGCSGWFPSGCCAAYRTIARDDNSQMAAANDMMLAG
jgi:hypothetical protein